MPECKHEAELLEAAHTGVWPHELRGHAAQCPACQELAAVMGLLLATPEPVELPSAGFLWWKGQLQAQRARTERAQRPIAVAEACAVAGVAAAAMLLLAGATWILEALVGAAVALPLAWYLRYVYQSE